VLAGSDIYSFYCNFSAVVSYPLLDHTAETVVCVVIVSWTFRHPSLWFFWTFGRFLLLVFNCLPLHLSAVVIQNYLL